MLYYRIEGPKDHALPIWGIEMYRTLHLPPLHFVDQFFDVGGKPAEVPTA